MDNASSAIRRLYNNQFLLLYKRSIYVTPHPVVVVVVVVFVVVATCHTIQLSHRTRHHVRRASSQLRINLNLLTLYMAEL